MQRVNGLTDIGAVGSYKCEAFYLRDENWWLFLEFRCLVVFACLKAAAVAAWTIYVLIKYVSLPPEKSS